MQEVCNIFLKCKNMFSSMHLICNTNAYGYEKRLLPVFFNSLFYSCHLFCRSTQGGGELRKLSFQYNSRSSESREVLVEDRTKAHADHVGVVVDRQTTWAVGALKAVTGGHK